MQYQSAKPNELVSGAVDSASLSSLMRNTSSLFAELSIDGIIIARYGYGSQIHPDLTYLPMKVGASWLDRFIRQSLDQRIVLPGESDFILEVNDGDLELEYCHDGHVHLSGNNQALVRRAISSTVLKGIQFRGASPGGA